MQAWRFITLIFLALLIGSFEITSGRGIKTKHNEIEQGDSNHIFNHTLAKIVVQYASAVYTSDVTALFEWTCNRCSDKIKDFEMFEVIVDVDNCLQAFVGVDPNLNTTIIAFRGTQDESIKNWMEDLFWIKLDLNYPGMPGAMVHHGFYKAYHDSTLRPTIFSAVQNIRKKYGNLSLTVTGHSMGAALASFCALDFAVNYGEKDIELLTFGQPRIGNAIFATCFNEYLPKAIRLTHQNDIVPHLPPYYSYFPTKTYHHISKEVWIHKSETGNKLLEKICDGSGEDPTCSRSVYGNSISDHMNYYDVDLFTDGGCSCEIVLSESTKAQNLGANGNVRLSRDPNAKPVQPF
ncbi:hypothetical protein LUZ60_012395 [Juncus effusus]|nr:hypothetical protein LUZ60_015594 [Juncus effusus]KAJ3692045.1 hypothetical protein LUZ60_012395 [Juncus effusus]